MTGVSLAPSVRAATLLGSSPEWKDTLKVRGLVVRGVEWRALAKMTRALDVVGKWRASGRVQTRRLRSLEEGIPMDSRYFATVRRATLMPC